MERLRISCSQWKAGSQSIGLETLTGKDAAKIGKLPRCPPNYLAMYPEAASTAAITSEISGSVSLGLINYSDRKHDSSIAAF